jgi:hypothetical protein
MPKTSHSVTLANLNPDTVYNWRAVSRDDNGNVFYSESHRFRTPAQ